MSDAIRVSAPGSIMITGEHAVVYGAPAIVCAIEQRIEIKAAPIASNTLEVQTEIAPPLACTFDDLPKDGPYRFVASAIAQYTAQLRHGIRLEITSQIDPTLGLGSSAAVISATLGILARFTKGDQGPAWRERLHSEAVTIVRHLQGRGSGADLAASLFGGMVAYQLPRSMLSEVTASGEHADIFRLDTPPPMGLSYCGYKMPTGEVLAKIASARVGNEAKFDALYDQMGENATRCVAFAKSKNWPEMGRLMNEYQLLMESLGVSDAKLDQIISDARRHPELLAAKISGSGLGDCVLAFGDVPKGFTPVKFAEAGLLFHD